MPEDAPLDDQLEGSVMLYSSGTTGRPKGVRRPLPRVPAGDPKFDLPAIGLVSLFGMKEGEVYLSPAPLYHAAPLAFSAANHRDRRHHRHHAPLRSGGGAPPDRALPACQNSQWVPTHFIRLLRLPEAVRKRYDVSSLKVAVHAAAPCPVPVKEAMIEWWGDAIMEYYAGTEGGGTLIRAKEWLAHKGSVGRHWAGGKVHLLDEEGKRDRGAAPRGRDLLRGPARRRGALPLLQGRPEDRGHLPRRTSSRSATSATSTRRATSTSPTASRT